MWDDLFGGWSPQISGDLRTWGGPQTLPLIGRVFGFLGAALIVSALIAVVAADGQRLAIQGPAAPTLTLSVPVVALAFAAYLVRWRTRGGWITIDPAGRTLTLRRPWSRQLTGTWSLDEVTAVTSGANSVTLQFAGAPGRLRVRAAPKIRAELAVSLHEFAGRSGDARPGATTC